MALSAEGARPSFTSTVSSGALRSVSRPSGDSSSATRTFIVVVLPGGFGASGTLPHGAPTGTPRGGRVQAAQHRAAGDPACHLPELRSGGGSTPPITSSLARR